MRFYESRLAQNENIMKIFLMPRVRGDGGCARAHYWPTLAEGDLGGPATRRTAEPGGEPTPRSGGTPKYCIVLL